MYDKGTDGLQSRNLQATELFSIEGTSNHRSEKNREADNILFGRVAIVRIQESLILGDLVFFEVRMQVNMRSKTRGKQKSRTMDNITHDPSSQAFFHNARCLPDYQPMTAGQNQN